MPRTQCLGTAIIGAAFCASKCSAERLARDLAFFPPEPPSYALERRVSGEDDDGETREGDAEERLVAVANDEHVPASYARAFQRVLDTFDVASVETVRGNEIVVMTCEGADEQSDGADVTIIMSHGNAVDAGEMAPFARKMAQQLACRVVVYDYSGYGQSRGEPSVADTYADIDAVVDFVTHKYGVGLDECVLFGQSIGSGPTCYFASKRENDIGAVVLVSPLLSALHVVSAPDAWCTPAKVFKRMDVYKNYAVVKTINAPILLIHGDRDEVVHQSHGKALWEAICKHTKPSDAVCEPYWIPGAGHDDTYERNPAEFVRHMRGVCAVVRGRYQKRRLTAGASVV